MPRQKTITLKQFYPIYLGLMAFTWFFLVPIVLRGQAPTVEEFVKGELIGFAMSFIAVVVAKQVYGKGR